MADLMPKSNYKRRKTDVTIGRDRTILVMSDLHAPYHDINAINEAIHWGQSSNVDTVILLGDVMDFHRISRYPSDPGTLSFAKEIEIGNQILLAIRENFRNAEIYYIEGNHEVRLDAYIQKNASEFYDLPDLRLERLLDLYALEIQWVSDVSIHCGDMSFIHGHEMRGIGGVNPSRKLYTKMKKSAICGHLHRPESFYTRDGAGKLIQCHVVGHLGDPTPNYHPRNDWQHGFAIVDVTKKGNVYVENRTIS